MAGPDYDPRGSEHVAPAGARPDFDPRGGSAFSDVAFQRSPEEKAAMEKADAERNREVPLALMQPEEREAIEKARQKAAADALANAKESELQELDAAHGVKREAAPAAAPAKKPRKKYKKRAKKAPAVKE